MANPTTNYGFVLPAPTDLVTDLPADFDIALQGVDTRLKALQPGTTLGDLAYSSATANTNSRLGIGTNGQVLAVVAGEPAWAAAANFVGASVFANTLQVIATATETVLAYNDETFDTNNFHSNVTNNTRLTIPAGLGGYYLVIFNQRMLSNVTGRRIAQIKKNGVASAATEVAVNLNGSTSLVVSQIVSLVATDFIEGSIFQTSGVNLDTVPTAVQAYLQIQFLGA